MSHISRIKHEMGLAKAKLSLSKVFGPSEYAYAIYLVVKLAVLYIAYTFQT